ECPRPYRRPLCRSQHETGHLCGGGVAHHRPLRPDRRIPAHERHRPTDDTEVRIESSLKRRLAVLRRLIAARVPGYSRVAHLSYSRSMARNGSKTEKGFHVFATKPPISSAQNGRFSRRCSWSHCGSSAGRTSTTPIPGSSSSTPARRSSLFSWCS